MKLTKIALLSTAMFFPLQLHAATISHANKWFEIEVILFHQIGDKSVLKETFPASVDLPKYNQTLDLIGPYLNPDIKTLKAQIPHCDSPNYKNVLKEQSKDTLTLFKAKTLEEIFSKVEQKIAETNFQDVNQANFSGSLSDNLNSEQSSTFENEAILIEGDAATNPNIALNPSVITDEKSLNEETTNEELTAAENIIELTEQQKLLVAEAELAFSPFSFPYAKNQNTKQLCIINEAEYNQLFESDHVSEVENEKSLNSSEHGLVINKNYSYYGFNIDKTPTRFNGAEDLYSKSPYLLNKDSLELSDIVTQLYRSKNFKPLMHIGWRQQTKTKRLAIPLKINAGDNLAYNYQKELELYLAQVAEQEAALVQAETATQLQLNSPQQITDTEQSNAVMLTGKEIKNQQKQLQLNKIINAFEQLPSDENLIITQLEDGFEELTMPISTGITAPTPPIQPWSLQGFIKVEVDHYLHITADFNVVNKSLAQLATEKLSSSKVPEVKSINFKQDRRVISNEIHYFDHPYVGMVIQIRRHKQLEKPSAEELTENATALIN